MLLWIRLSVVAEHIVQFTKVSRKAKIPMKNCSTRAFIIHLLLETEFSKYTQLPVYSVHPAKTDGFGGCS